REARADVVDRDARSEPAEVLEAGSEGLVVLDRSVLRELDDQPAGERAEELEALACDGDGRRDVDRERGGGWNVVEVAERCFDRSELEHLPDAERVRGPEPVGSRPFGLLGKARERLVGDALAAFELDHGLEDRLELGLRARAADVRGDVDGIVTAVHVLSPAGARMRAGGRVPPGSHGGARRPNRRWEGSHARRRRTPPAPPPERA